jgi:hypothetical protein
MILLAFLVHTALDWMDTRYAKVRGLLPSRRTFFEHLRALLQYLPFDDWDHLMRFMQQRLAPNAPDTGNFPGDFAPKGQSRFQVSIAEMILGSLVADISGVIPPMASG